MMKKYDFIEKPKLYAKWDWVVYLTLLVVICGIFLAVFLPKKSQELAKIEVYFGEQKIYNYDTFSQKGVIIPIDGVKIEEYDKNGKQYIKISTKYGINVLEFFGGYATMVEADCSILPDCVHKFRPIKNNGDSIICLPHRIKVVGVGKNVSNEVVL